MESTYLKHFLQKVGNSVHSINTIVVGLDGVEKRVCTKSNSLTITWSPKDPKVSSRSARKFVINASLVFITEAIKQYMLEVMKNPLFKDRFQDIPTDKQLSEKFELFSNKFIIQTEYWIPCVLLLFHWRNQIVHTNSKAKLSSVQVELLKKNSQIIKQEHAHTDIEVMLEHFQNHAITLKDISTLIAITIKTIRSIDGQLEIEYKSVDEIMTEVKNIGRYDEYLSICKETNLDIRSRKLNHFLRLYFKNLHEDLENELINQCLKG